MGVGPLDCSAVGEDDRFEQSLCMVSQTWHHVHYGKLVHRSNAATLQSWAKVNSHTPCRGKPLWPSSLPSSHIGLGGASLPLRVHSASSPKLGYYGNPQVLAGPQIMEEWQVTSKPERATGSP
jgi:hypothetical protein